MRLSVYRVLSPSKPTAAFSSDSTYPSTQSNNHQYHLSHHRSPLHLQSGSTYAAGRPEYSFKSSSLEKERSSREVGFASLRCEKRKRPKAFASMLHFLLLMPLLFTRFGSTWHLIHRLQCSRVPVPTLQVLCPLIIATQRSPPTHKAAPLGVQRSAASISRVGAEWRRCST